MKPEQLQALIRYRLQQAAESLTEAALLRDANAYRGTVNRAYYAMFYALLALLAARLLQAESRERVRSKFLHSTYYVAPHLFGSLCSPGKNLSDRLLACSRGFKTAVRGSVGQSLR